MMRWCGVYLLQVHPNTYCPTQSISGISVFTNALITQSISIISVHLLSLSPQPSWMVLVVINWFSPHTGLQEELRNWLNMLGPAKFSTRCSASSSHLWCIWMAINCHPVENLQYSDWDGIFISGNCWVVWFKLSGYLEVDKCESPYMVYQLDEHRIFKIFCCFRILQLC